MSTNILAIPYQEINFRTFSHTSWRDGFIIPCAGPATGYPSQGNTGNGTVSIAAVAGGASFGTFVVLITAVAGGATTFVLQDLKGDALDVGQVGVPLTSLGLTFTVAQGLTPFAVGDVLSIAVARRPLDISGVTLAMMLRRSAGDPQVMLWLSSDANAALNPGTIVNGGGGGQVNLYVEPAVMSVLPPGLYVYDMTATADGITVPVCSGVVDHRLSVTYAS